MYGLNSSFLSARQRFSFVDSTTKVPLRIALVIFFVFFLVASHIRAEDEVDIEGLQLFHGQSAIQGRDEVRARNNAISVACQKVLEDHIKKILGDKEWARVESSISDVMLKNPFKFIKHYQVQKTNVLDGIYTVSVTAEVHHDLLMESLALVKTARFQRKIYCSPARP